jgi:hypothetical protein
MFIVRFRKVAIWSLVYLNKKNIFNASVTRNIIIIKVREDIFFEKLRNMDKYLLLRNHSIYIEVENHKFEGSKKQYRITKNSLLNTFGSNK